MLCAAVPHLRAQAREDRIALGTRGEPRVDRGHLRRRGPRRLRVVEGGLVALTRVAAMELAKDGITANALAPFAATRVTERIVPKTDAETRY